MTTSLLCSRWIRNINAISCYAFSYQSATWKSQSMVLFPTLLIGFPLEARFGYLEMLEKYKIIYAYWHLKIILYHSTFEIWLVAASTNLIEVGLNLSYMPPVIFLWKQQSRCFDCSIFLIEKDIMVASQS